MMMMIIVVLLLIHMNCLSGLGASCVSLKRRGAAGGGVNARGVAVILNDPIFATNTLLVMLL